MVEQKAPMTSIAQQHVYAQSVTMIEGAAEVKGYDLDKGIDYEAMFKSYSQTGFQATYLGEAIERVNEMIKWRLSDDPVKPNEDPELLDPEVRKNVRCTIFLGFTSNMISCGMREYIKFLAKHKMVDCMVTTCGGIEEDFMKCLAPMYIGDFQLKGKDMRLQGLNRTGNLIVPNNNYVLLEQWFVPILKQMHKEQDETKEIFTSSKIIRRMGLEINNEDSVFYWCAKNDIPVFCPAITDGAIGDMLYFHSYDKPGFIVDYVQDIRKLNDIAVNAKKSGQLILGGGVIKHHICNANLMRNGANFSVFINTGVEMDGSDAGARPDEAVSWGKIALDAKPVKIWTDASLVFPILVAETFARNKELAKRN